MIKFRLYSDKDLEEIFLNKMVSKGYAMTKFRLGVYWFVKCERGEYTYKIDLVNDKDKNQQDEYYDLIRETGGEIVQSSGVWVFLRKKGEFELYTDNESKIEQYNRIKDMSLILALAQLMAILTQLIIYSNINIKIMLIISNIIIFTCTFLAILLLYQIYKCNIKIENLKKLIGK
ncbi:hypothetical protein GCM10008904_19900 [Paraclostridium ghonii]|uniref:DUF2812 domain-containing protein n=1 Tax=Paraclostridium ghonii TaxID=29358 RepID=A0ABU0MXA7_9FIRM|nr:DUF2812 domain-containing protein [Paeniclostridium ghonii]MDQ0555244.1 hypothetical protein [Paeniclostridium ghonii]